jgi:hypothetical protein
MMHLRKKAVPKAHAIVYLADTDWSEKPVRELDYRPGGPLVGKATTRRIQRHSGDFTSMPTHGHQIGLLPGTSARYEKQSSDVRPPDEAMMTRWASEEIPRVVFERGFTREAYAEFGLGNDVKNRRWVFPVRDVDGAVVGLTARIYWNESYCFRCGTELADHSHCPKCRQSYVKYKHHPGRWRRMSVFGIERVVSDVPLVIVEGTTDVLRLWQHGVVNPVSILGSFPSFGQIELIASHGVDVFVVGDGDAAGAKMNAEICEMMSRLSVNVTPVTLSDGQDPGSLSLEQTRAVLPERCFGVEDEQANQVVES